MLKRVIPYFVPVVTAGSSPSPQRAGSTLWIPEGVNFTLCPLAGTASPASTLCRKLVSLEARATGAPKLHLAPLPGAVLGSVLGTGKGQRRLPPSRHWQVSLGVPGFGQGRRFQHGIIRSRFFFPNTKGVFNKIIFLFDFLMRKKIVTLSSNTNF